MLRIIRIDRPGARPTIRLEGKLLTQWVDEVNAACRAETVSPLPVDLDLSMVTFADQAGIELLRSLVGDGIQINTCTSYIAELLQRKEIR